MPRRTRSIGRTLTVDISGPPRGHAVVILEDPDADPEFVDSVRARLHIALLRTVVITPDRCPHPQEVLETLRRVGVSWSLLVADRGLGPLAWTMAATHRERFSGLVVADCPHPRVADAAGTIIDPHCPPVLANTTALVSENTDIAIGRASGRYVHGQFRLARLARHVDHRVVQLATEIVLHAHNHH
ncbi:alpha/beta hydrolase [Mycolicibacterium agri]|uniref:alpha/beta hydrolase n=1 Tax=Mycolicibacterium agri TaxID=36811 RepID=UPI0013D6EC41|nr:alpha/beta hydrolase [Mycolicibacterium agri]